MKKKTEDHLHVLLLSAEAVLHEEICELPSQFSVEMA